MVRRRRRRSRNKGYVGKFIGLLIVLAAAWVAGFFVYLDKVPRSQPDLAAAPKADAIAVLTGGAGRLELGLELLRHDRASQLFVTGVEPSLDKATLLANQSVSSEILDCCITLGHAADDTFGNAAETAAWMSANDLSSLYIVTANYHMPRSLVEFRSALPEAQLLSRVVHPDNVRLDDWWRWPGTIQLLAAEYTKFLIAQLRAFARSVLPR